MHWSNQVRDSRLNHKSDDRNCSCFSARDFLHEWLFQTDEYFHNPIGTGPYKIQEWDEGQSITLVKNEDYYKGAPKIDTIVFKIVPDDNAKAL